VSLDVYGYGTPWWKMYDYMRFRVKANGTVSAPWGG
jgi:hypothetical protein